MISSGLTSGHISLGTLTSSAICSTDYKLYAEWDNPGADPDSQQAKLNVVRDLFAQKSFRSMIAALKQAIAISATDPEWARVRPPLVELTAEQARTLATVLQLVRAEFGFLEQDGGVGPHRLT